MRIGFNTKHLGTAILAGVPPGSGDPMTIIRENRPKSCAALDAFRQAWADREVFGQTPGQLVVTIVLDHDGASPLHRQKTARTGAGFAATLLIQGDDLRAVVREKETDAIRDRLEAELQTILREVERMLP